MRRRIDEGKIAAGLFERFQGMGKPDGKHGLYGDVAAATRITPKRACRLWIGVGNGDSIAVAQGRTGKIDGEGGFTNTALLANDRDFFHS